MAFFLVILRPRRFRARSRWRAPDDGLFQLFAAALRRPLGCSGERRSRGSPFQRRRVPMAIASQAEVFDGMAFVPR